MEDLCKIKDPQLGVQKSVSIGHLIHTRLLYYPVALFALSLFSLTYFYSHLLNYFIFKKPPVYESVLTIISVVLYVMQQNLP